MMEVLFQRVIVEFVIVQLANAATVTSIGAQEKL